MPGGEFKSLNLRIYFGNIVQWLRHSCTKSGRYRKYLRYPGASALFRRERVACQVLRAVIKHPHIVLNADTTEGFQVINP